MTTQESDGANKSENPTGNDYGEKKGIPAGRPGRGYSAGSFDFGMQPVYAYGQTVSKIQSDSRLTASKQSQSAFKSKRTVKLTFIGIIAAWCTTCLLFATTNTCVGAGLSTVPTRFPLIHHRFINEIFSCLIDIPLGVVNALSHSLFFARQSRIAQKTRGRVDFDKPNLILGYLAVPQKTAEEFNAHGFTAIPVPGSSRPLGNDGTYVEATAIPDRHLPELVEIIFLGFDMTLREGAQCAVLINTLEMVRTLRGYVDDVKSPAYNQPRYLTYFTEDLQKEWKNKGKHFVPGPPLLAARMQKGWSQLVVLVPYHYLLKSPSNPRQPSGDNHLKLSLKCTPKGTSMDVELPPPEWEQWGFEYWPKGLKS
ncbi:hypothetical protein EV368DRAFT_63632 [Lentinula lateritia]|nr:hypothetical protein EV368DRAFT_63632 [Lentinula lateritia]